MDYTCDNSVLPYKLGDGKAKLQKVAHIVIDSHKIKNQQEAGGMIFGGSLITDISVTFIIPKGTRNFKVITKVFLRNVTVVR